MKLKVRAIEKTVVDDAVLLAESWRMFQSVVNEYDSEG